MYSNDGPIRRHGCLFGCLSAFVVVCGLAISAWIFLPKIGAAMLSPDSALSPIPRETREEIRTEIRKSVNGLERFGVTRPEAEKMIDEITAEKVGNIVDSLRAADRLTPDVVIGAVSGQIDLSGVDIGALKEELDRNFDEARLSRLISRIDRNDLMVGAFVPVLKKTAKELLAGMD